MCLYFERIREELTRGWFGVQAAISAGYDKAFVDHRRCQRHHPDCSHVVLFSLGTGPIKGFAITLCIGILTSMFTAIMGTRVTCQCPVRRASTCPLCPSEPRDQRHVMIQYTSLSLRMQFAKSPRTLCTCVYLINDTKYRFHEQATVWP